MSEYDDGVAVVRANLTERGADPDADVVVVMTATEWCGVVAMLTVLHEHLTSAPETAAEAARVSDLIWDAIGNQARA